MDRRRFFATTLVSALAATLRGGEPGRRPRILLRSSWQVVNIGDIAHTPGVLALLEKHLPEAEVRLWASSRSVRRSGGHGAPAVSRSCRIVKGSIGDDGKASNPELAEARGVVRLPAARLRAVARRGRGRGRLREAHRQAVRRLRHHARLVLLRRRQGAPRAAPGSSSSATPCRWRRPRRRRACSARSWSSARTARSPATCATTKRPRPS